MTKTWDVFMLGCHHQHTGIKRVPCLFLRCTSMFLKQRSKDIPPTTLLGIAASHSPYKTPGVQSKRNLTPQSPLFQIHMMQKHQTDITAICLAVSLWITKLAALDFKVSFRNPVATSWEGRSSEEGSLASRMCGGSLSRQLISILQGICILLK